MADIGFFVNNGCIKIGLKAAPMLTLNNSPYFSLWHYKGDTSTLLELCYET